MSLRISSAIISSALIALTFTTAPVMAKKQKLNEWYTINQEKALVTLEIEGMKMVLDVADEKQIDRKGFVIQYLKYRPTSAATPLMTFVVSDLGYSDRTFGPRAGDTFGDRVMEMNKGAKITGEGESNNQYGALEYVRYTEPKGAKCIAVKQYGGFTGAGDSDMDEGGSTVIEGFFCADPHLMTEAMEQKLINGYRADL